LRRKLKNIADVCLLFSSPLFIIFFLLFWEIAVNVLNIDKWILPAPSAILKSFYYSLDLITFHAQWTLFEALLGLIVGLVTGSVIAVIMQWSETIKKMIYPLIILTQTIPFITIAPLLVIWFGYTLTAKIIIIALVCFFPVAINLENGFSSVEYNFIKLIHSLGGNRWQLFSLVKLPFSLPFFFSGIKIAASYAILSAVISEWIGSDRGLGILLIRSSKSYLTDRVFAVVLVISLLSMVLVRLIDSIAVKLLPWYYHNQLMEWKKEKL